MTATQDRRPRIVDVASHAGVSAQTVSNVINGRGGFTEPTRIKVEAAVAALGFRPNRYAQSLRSRRTGLIGFDMVRRQLDANNPFTVDLLHALVPAATRHDRRVLVFTHDEDRPEDFEETVSSGLVDGFILSDSTVGDPRVPVLQRRGVPFVVLGRPGGDAPVATLDIDNVAAMRQAVDHVLDQGCRDIAFITYSGTQHWYVERRQGVREALSHRGIRMPRHRQLAVSSLKSLRSRLPDFLAAHGTPEAIVTTSDSIAVAVVAVATMLGITVGEDMAVTGFDDGPLATMISPELTSVALPVEPIAEQLITQLEGVLDRHTAPTHEEIATRLVIRASSGFTPRDGD